MKIHKVAVVDMKAGKLLESYELEGFENTLSAQTVAQGNASRDWPNLGGQVEVFLHIDPC